MAAWILSPAGAWGQADEGQDSLPNTPPANTVQNDAAADSVSTKSFRKAPLDPEKIAQVFRAQAAFPKATLPAEAEFAEEESAGPTADPKAAEPEVDDESIRQAEIAGWIAQLGAPEFAIREQATAGLRKLGDDALPALRNAAVENDDLEVRLRAEDVASGIVSSAVAGRIDSFLDGQPGSFEGWDVFQAILGDGPRLREVFIEMMLRHQDLVQSLDVGTEARMQALEKVIARIQHRQLLESQLPSGADVIAMLLCFNDHDLRLSNIHEEALLRMLRMSVTTELLRDEQLAEPFRTVLAGWIQRCDRASWPEVFWLSMQENLDRTLPLAERVLGLPDASMDETVLSLQLISRFGNESSVAAVRPMLDDDRAVTELEFIGGKQVRAEVRDLAAAAIMILKHKPLDEIGLNPNSLHPKIGFIPRGLGFPTDDPAPRLKMLKSLQALLETGTESKNESSEKRVP
ncbi:hypothetical protein [Rhodopirellula sp. P2]|uniref:hypothetical protein n=1 Tax=Rhodopirellula sp. P2 TaxID=2127060 RepID=UPI002367DD0B|nr:hypothetical protein [Rhodopirellula sp. P2]WDQ18993.1 hypothetical protein PSR62_10755 [Rhodopirellula sp. P2]